LNQTSKKILNSLIENGNLDIIDKEKVDGFYSLFPEKYQKFGVYTFLVGMNFVDPKLLLSHLLIDDGNVTKRNRENLMSCLFDKIGVAMNFHEKKKACWVISVFGNA